MKIEFKGMTDSQLAAFVTDCMEQGSDHGMLMEAIKEVGRRKNRGNNR